MAGSEVEQSYMNTRADNKSAKPTGHDCTIEGSAAAKHQSIKAVSVDLFG
jgi:hypothetical protein